MRGDLDIALDVVAVSQAPSPESNPNCLLSFVRKTAAPFSGGPRLQHDRHTRTCG